MTRCRGAVRALVLLALPAALLTAPVAAHAEPALSESCAGLRAHEDRSIVNQAGTVVVTGVFATGEQLRFTSRYGATVEVTGPSGADVLDVAPDGTAHVDIVAAGEHTVTVRSEPHGAVSLQLGCGVPPTVAIVNPAVGAAYGVGDFAIPDYSCEAGSNPVATCTDNVLDTSSVGERTFTVVATDSSGLRTSRSVGYAVAKRPQSLAWVSEPPDGVPWGRNTWYFAEAASSSGRPVTISSAPGSDCFVPPTVAEPSVWITLTRAGACTLYADQAGDDQYLPAERIVQTFVVGRQSSYVKPVKASKGLLGLTPTTFRAELDVVGWFGPSEVIWGYPGQPVDFFVGGKKVCTGISTLVASENPFDRTAWATCKATIGLPAALKQSTYTASYAGDDQFLPSRATAPLQ